MAYDVADPLKGQITGKRRTRQGLVCVLRPNRREPRLVTARTVGSMAKSARYNSAEEEIAYTVVANLPRIQSELCILARIAVLVPPLVVALKSAVAILTIARLISGIVPAGWPTVAAISALILSLGEIILALESYAGPSGFIAEIARRCEVVKNGN